MRLLTLCAVLSVVLAVSLASPVKTQVHDVSDSYSSSEEKENIKMKNISKDNNNEEDKSANSSEEQQPQKRTVVKDEAKDDSSSEENEEKPKEHNIIVVVDDDEILDIKKAAPSRSKRSFHIDNTSNSNNHLKVKDEGSIKYDKYLKLKRLRRALQDDEYHRPRFGRSADTSEENSSEEQKKGNKQGHNQEAGQEHSAAPAEANAAAPAEKPDAAPAEELHLAAKPGTAPAEEIQLSAKPDTAPAESLLKPEEEEHAKTDSARRRRSLDVSGDDNLSEQEQDVNEVFIFSNENQQASEENFKGDQLKNNEYVVLNDNDLEKQEVSLEKKTSEEDYAQGCGGSNGNQGEDSNENSNEDNETTYNTQ